MRRPPFSDLFLSMIALLAAADALLMLMLLPLLPAAGLLL
jgi:hypothetical protein